MLAACGIQSAEELFAHLPDDVRIQQPLALAAGVSEYEIVDYFRARAAECANGYASFLGAGVYAHYRPVMVDTVISRGEFLTSYTPYQAEISQGTLTTIFEFQTMICQLTGMDVANASMYDGSTAVPEAAMMAVRVTGRNRVLVARAVHPEYRGNSRAASLLKRIEAYAKKRGLKKLFSLTTHTPHWFIERGFAQGKIEDLPVQKQRFYNYQRNSLVLVKSL